MKLIYKEHEGQGTYVENYREVMPAEFRDYLSSLMMSGFEIKENNTNKNSFVALKKGDDAVMVAYYPSVREMRVVTEPNSAYFSFKDTPCEEKVQPLITQLDLVDFGLSYVVRLTDGRFIIFDGGYEYEQDADKLMNCLSAQSPHEIPKIAAWIMTHPHLDHYRCYLAFCEKYSDKVEIQCFIYNFPDAEPDVERIPDIIKGYNDIARFFAAVEKTGAKVYKAHTGQTYEFSGTKIEILSSPDDTLFVPVIDINYLSLIIKMNLAGQTILWATDGYFKKTKLAKRYGDYLKADILQAPHHLFYGGDKESYALINPHTLLVASFEEHILGTIATHKKTCCEENRYLIFDLDVQDVYCGGNGDVVLKIPYSPRPNGKTLLFEKYASRQKGLGAQSWYFYGTSKDDCEFTVINPIHEAAQIFVDLIFEDSKNNVNNIKITVPKTSFMRVNLMNPEQADPDAIHGNKRSLARKGIPEGVEFAVHFKANMPVVIKGKLAPDYYA